MPFDSQQILNTANSFMLGANRCSEQRAIGPGQFQMPIAPAVVCSAFAIELYFKAIIALEGGNAKGHSLSVLYTRCSSRSQLAVASQLAISQTAFEQKLKEIADAFVEWRYIFEQQSASIDPAFLNSLAAACKSVAESLSKSLAK